VSENSEYTWNHRVIHHNTSELHDSYAIHEVHYRGDKIIGFTEDPVGVVGNDVDELFRELNLMKDALSHPILKLTELSDLIKKGLDNP